MAPSRPMMDVSYGTIKGCSLPMDEADSITDSCVTADSVDSIGPAYGSVKSSSYGRVKSDSPGQSHGSVKGSLFGKVKSALAGQPYGRAKSSSFQPDKVESDTAAVDDLEEDLKENHEDKLSQLVRLQAADGHFIWNDVIAKSCGMTQHKLMAASPSYAKVEEVWITGLVVAMLEQMPELKDLWELVVRKARKYLEKQITLIKTEKLIQDASGLLTK